MHERSQFQKSREVLSKIARGINPVTGEIINEDNFINDPTIIRCFYHMTGILEDILNGTYSKRRSDPFHITEEQKDSVVLPEGKIGVNEFARCINKVLDMADKKLTGAELNKRLKKMNILSEAKDNEGKTNTVTNDKSHLYGFEMERRSFNGREYDKVLINDSGKKYLMSNIESIMGIKTPA